MSETTEKQIAALKKFGIPDEEIPSDRAEASKKLESLINDSAKKQQAKKESGEQTNYRKVVLKIPDVFVDTGLLKTHDELVATAYAQVKKLLPDEEEHTQKFGVTFGMIMNQMAPKFF